MTVHCKELYLANNIESLDLIATTPKTAVPSTFEKKCKTLEDLYQLAQNNLIDQEKAYVYLHRFLYLYNRYFSLIKDKQFMDIRFSKQVEKGRKQFEQFRTELIRRYSEKDSNNKENRLPSNDASVVHKSRKKYPDGSISCGELYSALNDQTSNLLLVDARPKEDFVKSRISIGNVINVPDEIIRSGLSAHSIEVPSEYKSKWDMRETYDVIVLMDWNSTVETMKATKLEKLLSSLVDWDPNKTYAQKPIILDGGYMEWGQQYPSMCTNPNFLMNLMNNELDELLDLDAIQYPSDENKAPMQIFQESQSAKIEEQETDENDNTREELLQKNKELSIQSLELHNKLLEQEREWKTSQDDNLKSKSHERLIAVLKKKLEEVTNEKNKIQEQFELYAGFDPMKENLEVNQIKEIADIDKTEQEKFMICSMMEQQRIDALESLDKSRALKPKAAGDNNATASGTGTDAAFALKGGKERPIINRANKPFSLHDKSRLFDEPIVFNHEGSGLVGLKNIRNTCYMNTVIQCIRNVPTLAAFFCSATYSKHIRRKPEAIIIETASLIRLLWSNFHQCLNPLEFYEKICMIEPNYRLGNHEDCMEFFLLLLNNLSEDCANDLQKPANMSPAQQAWFNQLGGKQSIFTELFYHQIKITQFCRNCTKTTYKFEMESTLMLPVPDGDFRLDDLMRNYLQDDIIDDYCCSKCKKPVNNSKKVWREPKILVVVLKRYKQTMRNNNVSVSKIDSRVSFPTANFSFGGQNYNLNSIAMHSGSMTSGHYTAACCMNYKWYEFNDEIVRPISIDEDSVKTKACAFFYSMNE